MNILWMPCGKMLRSEVHAHIFCWNILVRATEQFSKRLRCRTGLVDLILFLVEKKTRRPQKLKWDQAHISTRVVLVWSFGSLKIALHRIEMLLMKSSTHGIWVYSGEYFSSITLSAPQELLKRGSWGQRRLIVSRTFQCRRDLWLLTTKIWDAIAPYSLSWPQLSGLRMKFKSSLYPDELSLTLVLESSRQQKACMLLLGYSCFVWLEIDTPRFIESSIWSLRDDCDTNPLGEVKQCRRRRSALCRKLLRSRLWMELMVDMKRYSRKPRTSCDRLYSPFLASLHSFPALSNTRRC